MDRLIPCDQHASLQLVSTLGDTDQKRGADYVARTFPSIVVDISRMLAESSTENARESQDPNEAIRQQLKPFFAFSLLLGKCPQIVGQMFNYFKNSAFQPFPDNMFTVDESNNTAVYTWPGFNDDLIKDILKTYVKYLSFDREQFSCIWNWTELGRMLVAHPNPEIRYLSVCCLSIIFKPTRSQHQAAMMQACRNKYQTLIDLQIKYRKIYENTFRLGVDPEANKRSVEFAQRIGFSQAGYEYCSESFAQLANNLLIKRDVSDESSNQKKRYQQVINKFVTVPSVVDSISKVAYSISINRPCIVKGPIGSGKSCLLDYIAASTNRLDPPDYVKVQICDQIDSRILIGSYISTEVPGNFEWQPGPLTKAMIKGSWILFEDIGSATADVIQILHSVIENRNLSSITTCPLQLTNPHPEFRLLFTLQANSNNPSVKSLEKSCDVVNLVPKSDDELKFIIDKRFELSGFSSTVLKLFNLVGEKLLNDPDRKPCRQPNYSDLFKLCRRLKAQKISLKDGKISHSVQEILLIDSIDSLIAHLPVQDAFKIAIDMGQQLNLAVNEVQKIFLRREPKLSVDSNRMSIGRASLKISLSSIKSTANIAYTQRTLRSMESITNCINLREPVLLVGETGVGKTMLVQHIADIIGTKLVAINLSQQSDSADLIGGFKPVDIREIMRPIQKSFEDLFCKIHDNHSLQKHFNEVNSQFVRSKKFVDWLSYVKNVCSICFKVKEQTNISKEMRASWSALYKRCRILTDRLSKRDEAVPISLAFSDGTLLRAIKEGHWILLDEVNLAEQDVLQCLIYILDSMAYSTIHMQTLSESIEAIKIHPSFRIFACMNPSTDIGKKDLDLAIRTRFTEFFIEDVTSDNELRQVVESYVKACMPAIQIEKIVRFYQEVRARSKILSDDNGYSPIYTLRSLCRAMIMCSSNSHLSTEKALYESLKVSFFHQLDQNSQIIVSKLMEEYLYDSNRKLVSELSESSIPVPKDGHQYINVGGFWIQQSNLEPLLDPDYILTDSIHRNLKSLARIIFMSQRKLPILIQGNTSVGKTSLIMYLAGLTGNRCYRINNHEHTDLQEYIGRYVIEERGEIVFKEGPLVKAMRKGYWLILDELNLAPSELLEALNRVLDDNRELYIPETRELIKAHSKFMLFATQNPPGEYAGRKFLSRAFRNRFSELTFTDIPTNELEIILQERCQMPPQYAKKIVMVMRELQVQRRETGCFNGKQSYVTMRDLLRWGQRYLKFKSTSQDQYYDWEQHIAEEGLILLEGRVRSQGEAEIIKNIIEKVFKRQLDRNVIYKIDNLARSQMPDKFKHIYLSKEFKTMYIQYSRAIEYNEPVLLCGHTGCGKTTLCQMFAALNHTELLIYNCHLGTESSDFIGGFRPNRNSGSEDDSPFLWYDGPMVEAMKKGHTFLMDEISLADDAVLERINSVLEQPKTITLTEKAAEELRANENFRFVATMNPGGDYGKKELSLALRNRFTEIYCSNISDIQQIIAVIQASLVTRVVQSEHCGKILKIMQKFLRKYYVDKEPISVRDVLSWCSFMNKTTNVNQPRPLSIQESIINGASLVFFDQIGTCGSVYSKRVDNSFNKREIRKYLNNLVLKTLGKEPVHIGIKALTNLPDFQYIKFKKFVIPRGPCVISKKLCSNFICKSSTVQNNMIKIVRAMQLDRPILLEGDPGVGKTSIVTALAKMSGHDVIRINLSEQTDLCDLFGSYLPDTSDVSDEPRFSWCNGPLLDAIVTSKWILLDEMNLASQSVLEGLNSCLDHRGEIYISELNRKFDVNKSKSRIFACQNPHAQGGARKGLPQSFLNRFTSIYIKCHNQNDLADIIQNLYPNMPCDLPKKLVEFNSYAASVTTHEFNLRTLIYWCDLMVKRIRGSHVDCLYKPEKFVQFPYLDGIRSQQTRAQLTEKFEEIFMIPVYDAPYREVRLGESSLNLGRSILARNLRLPPHLSHLCILKYQMPFLESLSIAIEFNKMPILIGPSGVGKKSMIQILAGLTGNNLNIMSANQEMDTLELIGSYEQRNIQRQILDTINQCKSLICSVVNSTHKKDMSWIQIFNHIWTSFFANSTEVTETDAPDMLDNMRLFLIPIQELLTTLGPLVNPQQELLLNDLTKQVKLAISLLHNSKNSASLSGNFDWIDSILIKSIKEGSWLLIEDANLMNAATLDRLNSLVEDGGYLSLNERGSSPTGIEVIKPHPNFRIILTMNPENGELSRAMRNRGVEIYVQTSFFFEDFLMIIHQNGYDPEETKTCMLYTIMQTCYDVHSLVTCEKAEEGGSILANFGLNNLTTLTHHVRRGADLNTILAELLFQHYNSNVCTEKIEYDDLLDFVIKKMQSHGKAYQVKLADERYRWMNFRHDLMALTGGDADVAMVERDNKIFYDDFSLAIFKPGEYIDYIDVVSTCTAVKISFELSTRGDFDYRRGFIGQTFAPFPEILPIINDQITYLKCECLPVLASMMPKCPKVPINEIPIDSRNFPDYHHILQCIDLEGVTRSIELENRWLFSLQRVTLNMIVEFIEQKSLDDSRTSLYRQSERLRKGEITREHLIRPTAEIASDLYDLLNGILKVISNRCFGDEMITKIMPRSFWISYLICKLRRGYTTGELIAVSNQLPMLWALTYQKIIHPIVKDCEIANQVYKHRKFANRIEQITHFLDVSIEKPCSMEKAHYAKIVNKQASSFKVCESVLRESDRLFTKIIIKSDITSFDDKLTELIVYSGLLWSSSSTLRSLYFAEENLLRVGLEIKNSLDPQMMSMEADHCHKIATKAVEEQIAIFASRQEEMQNEVTSKLINRNRQVNAKDLFAPIWQFKLLYGDVISWLTDHPDLKELTKTIHQFLTSVNGLVISPRFYGAFSRYAYQRAQLLEEDNEESSTNRIALDIFTAFIFNFLVENVVLDHQLLTWTKLRVTTSNLPPSAPLLPEFCPIISFTCSYSLDMSHLKLNAYLTSTIQLHSLLSYLIGAYHKHKNDKKLNNLSLLADKFYKYRQLASDTAMPLTLGHYIKNKSPSIAKMIDHANNVSRRLGSAIKLIHFGYLTSVEYAPIFTIDPALKTREKLEVYRAELAHIKLDLYFKNTLFYWRTGENLQLNEVEPEEAVDYPFTTRVMIMRKAKLEKSIAKLRRELYNRPKSDDGSLYFELRKTIEVDSQRLASHYNTLMLHFGDFIREKDQSIKDQKINNVTCLARTMIKNLEKGLARLRSEYSLYTDILAYYFTGIGFMIQGLRHLFFEMNQMMQFSKLGPLPDFKLKTRRLLSFCNYQANQYESALNKIRSYSHLSVICEQEDLNRTQSQLLRVSLIELKQHLAMSPSDIKMCMPLIDTIVGHYHHAWLARKHYIESQLVQKEKFYEFRTQKTSLGSDISIEQQEFLDLCKRFPTYEHDFEEFITTFSITERDNLIMEQRLSNLNRSADLTLCNDICKAHYQLMIEASRNLLGHADKTDTKFDINELINLDESIKQEASILFSFIRNRVDLLDHTFESLGIEYFIIEGQRMLEALDQSTYESCRGTLNGNMDMLQEKVFNIYHDSNPKEAIKLNKFMQKIDQKIYLLRRNRDYEGHNVLCSIIRLMVRINKFLIHDPMMKFITGSHALLDQLEEWNQCSVDKEDKFIAETQELIEMIKSWRTIELESWKSSLHWVKRNYIDKTLCDNWFHLYGAFQDPITCATNVIRQKTGDESFTITPKNEYLIYMGFSLFIKNFLESATLGDHKLRLDLVHSCIIKSVFDSLNHIDKPDSLGGENQNKPIIDTKRLTNYAYNTYMQYRCLFQSVDNMLKIEEKEFTCQLDTEIKIVAWQNRKVLEVKNAFRRSHRKLNSIMSKYLDVLQRPIPSLEMKRSIEHKESLEDQLMGSEGLGITLNSISFLIQDVKPSMSDGKQVISRVKKINRKIFDSICPKYVENLTSIEDSERIVIDTIDNYNKHDVETIIIKSKDSVNEKEEKEKMCRQMYHSKKFALQSLFKTLRNLGMSFQRGLNLKDELDLELLSLEPGRGLLGRKSSAVLVDASRLVNDDIIVYCNHKYQQIVALNMSLLAQSRHDDLTADQIDRIIGYPIDLVLKLTKQSRIAARIYRNLLDIQPSVRCLSQLRENGSDGPILVHNYNQVHEIIKSFSRQVNRAVSIVSKIRHLMTCYKTYKNLEIQDIDDTDKTQLNDSLQEAAEREKSAIMTIISEIPEKESLFTSDEFENLSLHLDTAWLSLSKINSSINELLVNQKHDIIFTRSTLISLDDFYSHFTSSISSLVTKTDSNIHSDTPLGSLIELLRRTDDEVGYKIKHMIDIDVSSVEAIKSDCLELRIARLLKFIKISVQNTHNLETNTLDNRKDISKKSVNPKTFELLDFENIERSLKLEKIQQILRNIMLTINFCEEPSDIHSILELVCPMISIYVQLVAAYLNIMYSGLKTKLSLANQVILFLNELATNGFGLPYKDQGGLDAGDATAKPTNDNAGFGEGQGETDASGKIEFESQLDDLKNPENNDNDKDQDKVEAHDDGIEMTDDFGGDAHGPELGDKSQQDHDSDEKSDDENDEGANLDKEFGQVDQDEEHLDEKLWSDTEDDQVGDDDERDLNDLLNEDRVNENLLAARDDTIPEHKDDQKSAEDNMKGSDSKDDTQEMDDDREVINEDGVSESGDLDESEKLDQEKTSNDLTTQVDPSEGEAIEEERLQEQIEANIDIDDLDIESLTDIDDNLLKPDDSDQNSDTEAQPMDIEESIRPSPNIDDDVIDKQLENQIEFPVSGDPMIDPVQQLVQERAQDGSSGRQNQRDANQVDLISGSYCVFEESPDDPLDDCDGTPDAQQEINRAKPIQSSNSQADDPPLIEISEDTDKTEENNVEDEQEKIESTNRNSNSTKRCPTTPDKPQTELKRQKLMDAPNNRNHKEKEKPKNDFNDKTQFRHISSANTDDPEIIDLGSDEDDAVPDTTDQNEKQNEERNPLKRPTDITNNEPEIGSEESVNLSQVWMTCLKNCHHLVHELCQQLQIVLQPTKMSKYKGDYKTGKRINMRKIIAYVASHYRKDKIWLRRTKPSKRTYSICLAVDNSSSMSENNCRDMTYESLALLAKSLSIIEAGSLNVVSFGEKVTQIHDFDDVYHDSVGPKWLESLRFTDKNTSYADLLSHSVESFAKRASSSNFGSLNSVNQLLIIITDGRNITKDEQEIKVRLRELKAMRVVTFLVIIDDVKRNGGKSITDMKKTVGVGSNMVLMNYMELMPFPFYVLLRRLELMPSILGEVLRQWFEVVTQNA